MMVLDMAAQMEASLSVRYACLGHDLGKGTTPADVLPRHIGHEERSVRLLKGVNERLRVPNDCKELAEVVAREHGNIHQCLGFGAAALVRLLVRLDAFRKPARLVDILLACECDARGRLGLQDQPYPQADRLRQAWTNAASVATAPIAEQVLARGLSGPAIAKAISAERERVVALHLTQS
jgi:tRNA nucleotidyltransferase (CCA-adding enzyme)